MSCKRLFCDLYREAKSMSKVIKNGTLVFSNHTKKTDLLIDNEKIIQIGDNLTGDEVIDAENCFVFSGFIDAHTHLDMPVSGTVTADDFATGTAAALVGGTTMIIDFATQDRGHTLKEALDTWHKRADGNSSCDYGFHMAVTDLNEQTKKELFTMKKQGITSFKCYYAYDALKLDDSQMYEMLCIMKEINGVLGVHCENGDIINYLQQQAVNNGHLTPDYHPKTRPSLLEGEAVSRFLRLADLAGAKAWIVHLSSSDGLEEIRLARKRGQNVYVETCPQYLTLDESVYNLDGFESAKYICSPPVRSKNDQNALWNALQNNEIDIVSTDHCSFNFKHQKELGLNNFTKIPNGLPTIEHRPVVIYTCAISTGKITVCDMHRMLSENPARMFGLYPKKGTLSVGSDADIVIYNPNEHKVITAQNQTQNCDYTPFEGFKTVGSVRDVFLRGHHVVKNSKIVKYNLGLYINRGDCECIPSQ